MSRRNLYLIIAVVAVAVGAYVLLQPTTVADSTTTEAPADPVAPNAAVPAPNDPGLAPAAPATAPADGAPEPDLLPDGE